MSTIRNLWAFLVGDWHRSDVRSAALWSLAWCALWLPWSFACGWVVEPLTAASMCAAGAALAFGSIPFIYWAWCIVFGAWRDFSEALSEWARTTASEGQQIIRTREQSRRERGQLSVRDQGGELSGVE